MGEYLRTEMSELMVRFKLVAPEVSAWHARTTRQYRTVLIYHSRSVHHETCKPFQQQLALLSQMSFREEAKTTKHSMFLSALFDFLRLLGAFYIRPSAEQARTAIYKSARRCAYAVGTILVHSAASVTRTDSRRLMRLWGTTCPPQRLR